MKSPIRREVQCDFCHRLLREKENLDDWQPYAVIDPSNIWYEVIACPECAADPRKRKKQYTAQVIEEKTDG